MSLVPVLLVLFWPQKLRVHGGNDDAKQVGLYAKRLIPFLRGSYRWLWLGLAGLSLLTLGGILKLKVDTNYTKFFGPRATLTRSYQEVMASHFGQNPIAIVLTYPEGTTFVSKVYWESLLRFEGALGNDAMVLKVLSATQLIERVHRKLGMKGDAGNTAILKALSGNDDFKDFVTPDGRRVQLIAMTPYMSSQDLERFKRNIFSLGRGILPKDVGLEITGTTILWADMDEQISHTQMDSIYLIAVVFLVLMPLIFRSLKLGLIGVAVNALPLGITFGVMGLLNIRIDMATALIGGVAIGSTADSTLFFISRVIQGLQKGMPSDLAVEQAILTVGDGMIMTALILVGGFLCLATSGFLPTAHFGGLVSFSVFVALFMDIIVDPLILKSIRI